MSYRVRVKERGRPPGHVSIEVAAAVIAALRVALRAEAANFNARETRRAPQSKLERESIAMSLVGVESGTTTLVWESEAASLFDGPREMFDSLITEAKRAPQNGSGSVSMQKALLSLEPVLKRRVEWIEFIDEDGTTGMVDAVIVDRIRLSLTKHVNGGPVDNPEVVGRLLELDLAARTFQIFTGFASKAVKVRYDDILEPIVRDAMKMFVSARVSLGVSGERSLLSLEALDDLPDSQFDERRTLDQLISDQRLAPITDFDSLALDDIEPVDEATFDEFIRAIRHRSAD